MLMFVCVAVPGPIADRIKTEVACFIPLDHPNSSSKVEITHYLHSTSFEVAVGLDSNE